MPEQPPRRPSFIDVPDQGEAPVVWDRDLRRFVTRDNDAVATEAPSPPPERDTRKFFVGASAVGIAPPPPVGPAAPAQAAPAQAPSEPPSELWSDVDAIASRSDQSSGAEAEAPSPPTKPKTERKVGLFKRRPKLRWLFVILPLIPLLLLGAGLWYANSKFQEIHRVEVADLLDSGGNGTNILMVGSDVRAGVAEEGAEGLSGQRSDTIMVLHMGGDGDRVLSIPRDLIVTVAESGQKTRINAAYNSDLGGGPRRLIQTVKDNLHIPINRYMEVDFATFAGLVESLGGITIDFPNPAFDENSGLYIDQAGPQKLNGEMALAYVRSRHYTENINGQLVEDPTADLGRVKRQQQFLQTVLSKVGGSHNPFTLLSAGTSMTKGLAIDNGLGFWDAIRLAWDLKGFHPEATALPTGVNRDNATLHLLDAEAEAVLAHFR